MTDEAENPVVTPETSPLVAGRHIRPTQVIDVPEGTTGIAADSEEHGLVPTFTQPNWITYVSASGPGLITEFTSSWQVPRAPVVDNGQLLFLFNGLQNAARSQILQPVLQWGVAPWGGGPQWYVIPLCVDAVTGQVNRPAAGATPVVPGAILTGYTRFVQAQNGGFVYDCGFTSNGVQGPVLRMQTGPMVEAVQVLEAYGIVQAANYPNQPVTTFSVPQAMTPNGPTTTTSFPPNWAITNRVANYNQHAVVFPDRHVDIHYGSL